MCNADRFTRVGSRNYGWLIARPAPLTWSNCCRRDGVIATKAIQVKRSLRRRRADAAVGFASAEVDGRAGDERQHQRLGDPAGLDQSLRLAKRVVQAQRQRRVDHAEELDDPITLRRAGRVPDAQPAQRKSAVIRLLAAVAT